MRPQHDVVAIAFTSGRSSRYDNCVGASGCGPANKRLKLSGGSCHAPGSQGSGGHGTGPVRARPAPGHIPQLRRKTLAGRTKLFFFFPRQFHSSCQLALGEQLHVVSHSGRRQLGHQPQPLARLDTRPVQRGCSAGSFVISPPVFFGNQLDPDSLLRFRSTMWWPSPSLRANPRGMMTVLVPLATRQLTGQ